MLLFEDEISRPFLQIFSTYITFIMVLQPQRTVIKQYFFFSRRMTYVLCVREDPRKNFDQKKNYPEILRNFLQSLEVVSELLPQIMSQTFPFRKFPIHYSILTKPLDAMYS
jgi:hypothetical protein